MATILRLAQDTLYIGQAEGGKTPHGHGYLHLPDGGMFTGHFLHGKMHGAGCFVTPTGLALQGTWADNLRTGEFDGLDKDGVKWKERYNAEGKRVARKKVKEEKPNPEWSEGAPQDVPKTIQVPVPPGPKAQSCWNCMGIYHVQFNHTYACRQHKGQWLEDKAFKGEGDVPGVWSCCASQLYSPATGCDFQSHNLKH